MDRFHRQSICMKVRSIQLWELDYILCMEIGLDQIRQVKRWTDRRGTLSICKPPTMAVPVQLQQTDKNDLMFHGPPTRSIRWIGVRPKLTGKPLISLENPWFPSFRWRILIPKPVQDDQNPPDHPKGPSLEQDYLIRELATATDPGSFLIQLPEFWSHTMSPVPRCRASFSFSFSLELIPVPKAYSLSKFSKPYIDTPRCVGDPVYDFRMGI